jgi:hypothetical protein
MKRVAALAAAAVLLLQAAAPPVRVTPLGERSAEAAAAYRALWEAEGPRMAAALERAAGIEFPPTPIELLIEPGRPMASYDGRTIRLRPFFSPQWSRGTLMHELGHRLSFMLPRGEGLDDHQLLDLFLYDAWTDLYGPAFADRMVSGERRIGPVYDAAWTWALAMTREERQARLAELRNGERVGRSPGLSGRGACAE